MLDGVIAASLGLLLAGLAFAAGWRGARRPEARRPADGRARLTVVGGATGRAPDAGSDDAAARARRPASVARQ